ncbi:hypothetical protein CH381_25455 [Leptospira sp. mixed culture ATI2-C-A1]|nr:hypothetical protein CH381_25455 [Leptospira sp. mixed culture ATI2-C-A1]
MKIKKKNNVRRTVKFSRYAYLSIKMMIDFVKLNLEFSIIIVAQFGKRAKNNIVLNKGVA